MKKLLSFILLLFVPFMVKAQDIEIKSITLLEKIGDVEVKNEPKIDGTIIDFDLAFTNVDDSVKYKVVVKNTSNEDLDINSEPQYGTNKYIKYEIELGKESRTIKAGQERELTIVVSYDKEIPTEEFDDGVYNEKGSVSIDLNSTKENPKTSTFITIAIVIAGISLITGILIHHGMKKTAITTVLLSLVALPVTIGALKEVRINISSKIEITDRCYVLDTTYGSFDNTQDVKSICVKFAENKYYIERESFFSLTSIRKNEDDNLILNVLKEHFTEESFVRVYDKNDNLIKEVTLDDFPKPLLNVNTAYYYDVYDIDTAIGNLNKSDVRIELSEDLQEYEQGEVLSFGYGKQTRKTTIKGPWIKDSDAINKISVLKSHRTEEYALRGFERDTKDSHLYHAVWEKPSHSK